jgi:hypothetical protein
MGVEIRLSDRELPVSPAFVLVLAPLLAGEGFHGERWADQTSELLERDGSDRRVRAAQAAEALMSTERGRTLVSRAYTLLYALLTGTLTALEEIQGRFRFVTVIGAPRSGGSYLTAELYRALRLPPQEVPNTVAHDSFPDAAPFDLQHGMNGWTATLKTTAEYLTLVEVFFDDREKHEGRIVVPKKLTNAAYAGGFFHRVLGEEAEHVLTIRHPAAACVSAYDISGGLPANGRFTVRSNIEAWCRRDLRCAGVAPEQLERMGYFEAYLRYWEQYHLALATTGLAASRNLRIVPFDKTALEDTAQRYHVRFGSGERATEFHVTDRACTLHPDWYESAKPAIERVGAAWNRAGMRFPLAEICRGS